MVRPTYTSQKRERERSGQFEIKQPANHNEKEPDVGRSISPRKTRDTAAIKATINEVTDRLYQQKSSKVRKKSMHQKSNHQKKASMRNNVAWAKNTLESKSSSINAAPAIRGLPYTKDATLQGSSLADSVPNAFSMHNNSKLSTKPSLEKQRNYAQIMSTHSLHKTN
jgi:hypothetical protein